MPGLSKVQKLLFVVILFMTLCEVSNSYLMWYILHGMPTPHYLSLFLISYIRTKILYCYICSQMTIKIIPVYIPVLYLCFALKLMNQTLIDIALLSDIQQIGTLLDFTFVIMIFIFDSN